MWKVWHWKYLWYNLVEWKFPSELYHYLAIASECGSMGDTYLNVMTIDLLCINILQEWSNYVAIFTNRCAHNEIVHWKNMS